MGLSQLERRALSLIGRPQPAFERDLAAHGAELDERIRTGSFLVLGGAGSIGQAVVKAIFRRSPARLHVVDASENNLVELVRDIRSSYGYIEGDFRTLALDVGQVEFQAFLMSEGGYDHVLNLSALKHVRSERDPFTLMRMLTANVLNTDTTLRQAVRIGARRYFAVSSDKAANPANAMGASKRVMELCLSRASDDITVSSARFANVAFSDGSLLHGFNQRLQKRQPLAAPEDLKRYFITASEAAALCLASCLLGANREAFFPNVTENFEAVDFRTIAERFLAARGFTARPCDSEEEARGSVEELAARGEWPCYFFSSDTTGEKDVEEFTTASEVVDLNRFAEIGVVQWPKLDSTVPLEESLDELRRLRHSGQWDRTQLLRLLCELVPEFEHLETGKFLDSRM